MATTDWSFTQTNVGEKMSRRGGEEATGYLPPSAGQAGTAHHRTERWEPQAEGNNKKVHLNHSSGSQPRQSTKSTQLVEIKALASQAENYLDSRGY